MPRSVYNPCQTTTIARSASAFALLMTCQRCRKPCNCCAKRVCSRSQPSPLDRYQMRDVDPRGGRRCCDQRLIASANGHWLCVVRCKRRSASGLELNARCRRNCRPNWQRFRSVGIQKMILTRISSVPVDQSRRRRPRGSRQANRFWFHRLDGRYPPDTPHPAFCP
jgi:hypothetical protein